MAAVTVTIKELRLGSRKVSYWETGQENMPVLILIHGNLGNAELHWQRNLDVLGQHFHVYAPDLPVVGLGGESDPLAKPSILNLMQWLNEFIHVLELQRLSLLGSSFGATLCRFYAASYPALVDRLILVGGGTMIELPTFMRSIGQTPMIADLIFGSVEHQLFSPRSLPRAFYRQPPIMIPSSVQMTEFTQKEFAEIARLLINSPWPALRTPENPTLIIWGTEDALIHIEEAYKLQQELPHAQLVKISEAGHLPMLERPGAFHKAVVRFLKDL